MTPTAAFPFPFYDAEPDDFEGHAIRYRIWLAEPAARRAQLQHLVSSALGFAHRLRAEAHPSHVELFIEPDGAPLRPAHFRAGAAALRVADARLGLLQVVTVGAHPARDPWTVWSRQQRASPFERAPERPAGEPVPWDVPFAVRLIAVGDRQAAVLGALKTGLGVGLSEAKRLTLALPATLVVAPNAYRARALVEPLRAAGATVETEPPLPPLRD